MRVGRFLRSFARNEHGGFAVMFALGFIPISIVSLGVMDYARASTARQAVQEALDAATLLAARSTAVNAEDLDRIGDRALAEQLPTRMDLVGLTPDGGRLSGATFALDGSVVKATARADVQPMVASIFLGGPIAIKATSEVVRSVNKVEIAMVLDTTGSMSGTKITNLITAAKEFVTKMETAAARSSEPNPVKIAIVPFSTTVKVSAPVDVAAYNATTHSMTGLPDWLDGRAQSTPVAYDILTGSARTDRFALFKQMGKPWGGCVEARAQPYDIQEDAPASTDVNTLFTPFFWPDEPDTDNTFKNDYIADSAQTGWTWKQRQGNPNKYANAFKVSGTWSQGTGYGAALDYGPNAGCAMKQMQRLSTDFSTSKTTIEGLIPSGETNVPLGLMWGWHALSPNAPLADGVAYGTPFTTKIIILMTDGDNTMNSSGNSNDSWYHGLGYVWQNRLGITSGNGATRTAKMDARFNALCANIKAKKIVVYTVGVGVSDSAKTNLTNCATNAGFYFNVDSNGAELSSAFNAIAGSIQTLRISK